LNQVGLLPAGLKLATVATAASAPAGAARLLDAATGQAVWQGPLSPPAHWPAAGQTVRHVDFSAFQQPGRYRLQVPGHADSATFVVAADAYSTLNAAALKTYYFNRAGIELRPEHAGPWARPAGHADPRALVHASAATAQRPAGTVIESPRGWYDAGDYNLYIVNSGISTYTLLAAWEHFPGFFQGQRLNIPESGNGTPDVLNEVLWNLVWMLSMQDPHDGGVYHKLTDPHFDGTLMPHAARQTRYVVQKATAATLDFAAVMATASRVFAPFEAQHPGLAARMRQAALRAWAWALAHPDVVYRQPSDIHTGGYDNSELADEWAWAAAELTITTGEDRFLAAVPSLKQPCRVPGWADVETLGLVSLAHHAARLPASVDVARRTQCLRDLAVRLQADWAAAPQRVGQGPDDFYWGSNSVLLNRALVLLQAHRQGGPRAQLDAAQSALDAVLGRNALGQSMVTGFGSQPPRHPHHRPSEADGVAEPVPGFLVGGPNAGQQDAKNCPPYPSKLPALSYLDHYCSYASNEVAINWNAPLVYVSAALQVLTQPVRQRVGP
jgi:endoglucanase